MKLLISNYKIIFFNFNTLNFDENFRLCKIIIIKVTEIYVFHLLKITTIHCQINNTLKIQTIFLVSLKKYLLLICQIFH
jgi:hypothetical protein